MGAHLSAGVNGLYADHIGVHGIIEPTEWSYNQGTMIGAGALLYQATANSAYLFQARQTAKAALAYFTPERLGSENAFFVSVYFRNLLYLDSITHDPPGASLVQGYVNYAWEHLRLRDDVFVAGCPPPPSCWTRPRSCRTMRCCRARRALISEFRGRRSRRVGLCPDD